MVKYHINPETGRANICRAVNNCAFNKDGKTMEHYDTKQEAQDAFEKQNSQNNIHSVQKQTMTTSSDNEKAVEFDQRVKDLNQKITQLMNDEKYKGTVFQHRGKVIEQGRMSKEEYHRLQEEKDKKRKLERAAEKRAIEKERRRKVDLQSFENKKIKNIEELEKLSEKEEELKNDKKRVDEYINLLNRVSSVASVLEHNTVKIHNLSQKENKRLAYLAVEDAAMFEKKAYQNEYKELLEIRAAIRKRIKRNPLTIIKNTSADMRGVLTKEQSIIRSINRRINKIIERSYKWRITKAGKTEWKKFEESIDHLLDHDEK